MVLTVYYLDREKPEIYEIGVNDVQNIIENETKNSVLVVYKDRQLSISNIDYTIETKIPQQD